MKILFISGREPSYTRNDVILKGLKENNVEIIQCTSTSKSYLIRYLSVFLRFLWAKISGKKHEIVFIGFYGTPLVPFIRLFTRKPIILDAFVSAYQTLCFDRKSFKPDSLVGRLAFYVDKIGCKLSTIVLLDTTAHIDYFVKTFNIPKNKFRRIYVGANDDLFYPRKNVKVEKGLVFSYSQYQKVHGIEYIIEAANILKNNKSIRFRLIGTGREKSKIDDLVKKLQLKNIEFIDWVPYEKLPLEIAKAEICLGGHFGNTDKARMLIGGKTFQFVAMAKPTILGDNPGNKEAFTHLKDCYLAKMCSGKDIAKVILYLISNKGISKKIGQNSIMSFKRYFSPAAIGKEIIAIASGIIKEN